MTDTPADDPKNPPLPAPKSAAQHNVPVSEVREAVRKQFEQDEAWAKLNWFEKKKLETAYTAGILSRSILRDMGEILPLTIINSIPNPLGPVVTLAISLSLVTSYALRNDARGKEVRSALARMWKNGVPMEEFQDVVQADPKKPGSLNVKDAALAGKMANDFKNEWINSNLTAAKKVLEAYVASRDATAKHVGGALDAVLTPVIGEKNADKVLKDFSDGYAATEKHVGNTFNSVTGAVGKGFSATFNGIKHGVGAVAKVTGDTVEGTKKATKNFFGIFGGKREP